MRRTALADIRDALESLEIPRDRVVFIHSGMIKFGLLEGGSAGLLDVLRDVLGPDATLVMPAFTLSFGRSRVWHAADSKSEMGVFTEFFRTQPGVKRNIHPFHSVCAQGPLADAVVAGLCPSSFGPGSAYDRLYDLDALNLSIGTEFVGGATYLHMGEERARVPYRFMKEFPGEVRDATGGLIDMTFTMYARTMTDEYEYDTDWSLWWDELTEHGCFRTADLKGAMFCLSEIKKTLGVFETLILADPFRHARAFPRPAA
ncbi:MAG: AAC(3) family N-acetyltransferase [Phaeospirillum sp.]|nr:AAC(3) family N-acetyltransferase [Phaeospirillum sp.]